MDISTLSNYFGLVTGIAACITWLWKLQSWFKKRLSEVSQASESRSVFVAQLLDQATSPAKRADIHAYLHFAQIEHEGYKTRSLIGLSCGWIVFLIFLIFFAYLLDTRDTSAHRWFTWAVSVAFVVMAISLVSLSFNFSLLDKLYTKYLSTTENVLRSRATSWLE